MRRRSYLCFHESNHSFMTTCFRNISPERFSQLSSLAASNVIRCCCCCNLNQQSRHPPPTMRQYGAIRQPHLPVSTPNPGPITTPKPSQRLGEKLSGVFELTLICASSPALRTAAEGPIVSPVLAIALKALENSWSPVAVARRTGEWRPAIYYRRSGGAKLLLYLNSRFPLPAQRRPRVQQRRCIGSAGTLVYMRVHQDLRIEACTH